MSEAEAQRDNDLFVSDPEGNPEFLRTKAKAPNHLTFQAALEESSSVRNVRRSANCNELFAALAKAQAELGVVEFPRNKTVKVRSEKGNYEFSYCTFDEILSKALPITGKHGLSVIQSVTEKHVVTTIGHSSGQWWEAVIELPTTYFKPQEYGSAITYRKRYAFCSLLCIHADEDDDANIESGNSFEGQARKPAPAAAKPKPEPTKPATEERVVGMHGLTFKEWEKQQPKDGIRVQVWKALQVLSKQPGVADAIATKLGQVGQQQVWQLDAGHGEDLYETAKSLASSK